MARPIISWAAVIGAVACGTFGSDDETAPPVDGGVDSGDGAAVSDAADEQGDAGVVACDPCGPAAPSQCAISCSEPDILAISATDDVVTWVTESAIVATAFDGSNRKTIPVSAGTTALLVAGARVLWTVPSESRVASATLPELALAPSTAVAGSPFGLATRGGTPYVAADLTDASTMVQPIGGDGGAFSIARASGDTGLSLTAFPGAGGATAYVAFTPSGRIVEASTALVVADGGAGRVGEVALSSKGLFWTTPLGAGTSIRRYTASGGVTTFATFAGTIAGLVADDDVLYGTERGAGQSVLFSMNAGAATGAPTQLAVSSLSAGPLAVTASTIFFVVRGADARSQITRIAK